MSTGPDAAARHLDIEGKPIGPMTAAEFKVVREYLGLTTKWLADTLGVEERSVQRWEGGDRPISEWVRERIESIEEQTAEIVSDLVDALGDMADPAVITYRTDHDYRLHHPEQSWPASWHRAVVARAVQEVPGVTIDYWQES